MSVIYLGGEIFRRSAYKNEADLERAIIEIQNDLFGGTRIYIDVKKKIGIKGGISNIPDGYLLDLTGAKPRLFVVENELANHDPLRHIAIQILQFSLSFEADQRKIKSILYQAIQSQSTVLSKCEDYIRGNNFFRNLDHLLEYLVYESKFSALVIIDDMPEKLEHILTEKFAFGIEVIEIAKYESEKGKIVYHFEPFLADIQADIGEITLGKVARLDPSEIDTIIVPAREDGFEEVFLRENRWYAIRVHGSMRPQIKHIAVYRVAPISAVTHIAPVKSIEPWKDSEKYVVNFSEPAKEIGPIPLMKGGTVKPLYGPRYASRAALEKASSLDDIWR
jgi:hypothetical protein